MQPRINIVTLGVKDFERAVNFYQKGLGWKLAKASQDDIAFFSLSGIVLALYPYEKLAEDAKVQAGSGFGGITLAHNAKSEAEVDEILKIAGEAGAKIVKPAEKVFWGGYSGYFSDPDGYLWEVAYNPFFQFDVNDNLLLP
jgi:catechol 2,3-dioxygenase-like lactoylglutathione lyase family enzyme